MATAKLLHAPAAWCGGNRLRRDVRVLSTDAAVVWHPTPDQMPEDVTRVQVDGVLVPGLVDHHVHIEQIDPAEAGANGLAGVRDLGGRPAEVFAWRDRSRRDSSIPFIDTVGPFLTPPGGYPSDRAWAPDGTWREIADESDVVRAVTELAGLGAVGIKVVLHEQDNRRLSTALLESVVRVAGRARLPVIAHAEGAGEPERAIAAGVHEFAHAPWTHHLDDELIRRSAAAMIWTSTLDIHGWGVPTQQYSIAVDNVRRFCAAGGRVRYGTDLGNGPLPVGVNARELQCLSDASLRPAQILAAVCASNRSLAVVPADPLADPGRLVCAHSLILR